MEILLIIVGVVIFALGYFMPDRKGDVDEDIQVIGEDEVRKLVDNEMENIKGQISDIIDESITYSIEKTERSMERLSNEKIMAINEYSDTVLDEINKNHKEVLFLYDMLNDKHENIKNTMSAAAKTAEEVKQKVRDAEITVKEAISVDVDDFVPMTPPRVKVVHSPDSDYDYVAEGQDDDSKMTAAKNMEALLADMTNMEEIFPEDIRFESGSDALADISDNARNSNERILELHKAGKSDVAIAKDLGLGIGEVKFVIDLFEG
ncbi:MAG: DUF6115 domain-containing protein [Butyrivibrio sp.]|nr:DUF6115 domain-containing protein [Butyrivibrio sp.]